MILARLTSAALRLQITRPRRKARLAYLPEGAPAYGAMTPLGFLRFCGRIRSLRGRALKRAIEKTVTRLELASVLHQPVETLSKGYRRRVAFAQAILHDPPILILDEPTDGLDPNQKFQVRKLITEISAQKAIILSTHILEEVEAVCNRCAIVAAGRILLDTTPQKLIAAAPGHGVIRITVLDASAEQACQEISADPAVRRVEFGRNEQGHIWFSIWPHANANLMAKLVDLVHQQKWQIRSLDVQRGRLEDIFRAITQNPSTFRPEWIGQEQENIT